MLIEMGVPFEAQLVDIKVGAQHADEYRRVNPSGKIPTLVVDGVARGESASLLMLLAERHPAAALAPAPGSVDRGEWLELMIYLANTLLPAMRDWFYAGVDGELAGVDAVKALAARRIEEAWNRLDKHLADGRAYLVGESLSTVDFLAVMLMRWSRNMARPATTWLHLAPYAERLRALPSFIEVNAREGLADWPASAQG
jgi:glutathione S-transferase